MNKSTSPLLVAGLAATLCVSAVSESRAEVCCLLDPVVTHTNGMRLASTTSQRNRNVYWTCDPLHLGFCDCQMHGPCRSDLRSLTTRGCCGCFPLPPGPSPGPVSPKSHHSYEGVEDDYGASLGTIPLGPIPASSAAVSLGG